MTRSPMLWGAGLACALGGAVAGTALGSTPVLDRPAIGDFYQTHEQASRDGDARALPDHYPLVTREGIVPVEQLSERGLFSQARYRAFYSPAMSGPGDFVDASYSYGEPSADRVERDVRGDPALAIGDAAPAAHGAQPTDALELNAGPATVIAGAAAKRVDVALALASD